MSTYISYFARVNYRHHRQRFGQKQADRLLHTYIIGKTGTGKSTLLQTLIQQDIKHGTGLLLLDPHGDLVQHIYQSIPAHRKKDIIYLNLPDSRMPYRYNPLRKVAYAKRSLVAAGILEIFKKLFGSAWGLRMEHILRYILLTLLDQPQASIGDIARIIHDENYQKECIKNIGVTTFDWRALKQPTSTKS